MQVRSVGVVVRAGVCILCVCDNEECERGVGTGVNGTMLSETLKIVALTDTVVMSFRLRKKTINLCERDSE